MKQLNAICAGIVCSAFLGIANAQTSTTSTTSTTTTTNYQVFKICESDMDIYSSDNVSVGRIDSIVVEPEGRIASMVVAPSADLQVRDQFVVVPYTGARLTSNRIQLNVARDVIMRAPTVARTEVRTVVQPQFMERVNTHYRTASTSTATGTSRDASTTRDTSTTRGTTSTRDATGRDTTTRDPSSTTRDPNLRPPTGTERDATATRDAARPGDTNRPGARDARERENQARTTGDQRDKNADKPQGNQPSGNQNKADQERDREAGRTNQPSSPSSDKRGANPTSGSTAPSGATPSAGEQGAAERNANRPPASGAPDREGTKSGASGNSAEGKQGNSQGSREANPAPQRGAGENNPAPKSEETDTKKAK